MEEWSQEKKKGGENERIRRDRKGNDGGKARELIGEEGREGKGRKSKGRMEGKQRM